MGNSASRDDEFGLIRRGFNALRAYFPRGNTLDDESFRRRHLLMCWILALHIPALFAFGLWQDVDAGHAALEVLPPAFCLVFALVSRGRRRVAAFFVAAGLVYCSSVLVHLSYGSIEAHFHFFILIGLIALYQDWVPFLWNAVFTVLSHGIGGTLDPARMYNHDAGQNRPWVWALIHGASVLAACFGVLVFWRSTEKEQGRNRELATELATAELATAQAEAGRRMSMSQLLVNLARRNQSLLDRQLSLIAELEQREVEPDALANLFQLDHVATRIRRNAESLLVLSGDEPPRRWGQPVALPEVVRAAAAEVEDYRRVEILVNEHLEVAGRAVADLAHLLAELIENATLFSPPSSEVRVRSHLAPSTVPTYVVSIEDTGIGMTEADRQSANEILGAADDAGMLGSRLGFHVVNRLARRYGLQVQLAETPGGGITALVSLPSEMVSVRMGEPVAVGMGRAAVDGTATNVSTLPAGLGMIPPPPPPPPPPSAPLGLSHGDNASSWATSGSDYRASSAATSGPTTNENPVPGFLLTGRHPLAPPPPRPLPPASRVPPIAPLPPPPPLPPVAPLPPRPLSPPLSPPPSLDPPAPPATPAPPAPPASPSGLADPEATAGSRTTIRVPSLARRVPGQALAAVRGKAPILPGESPSAAHGPDPAAESPSSEPTSTDHGDEPAESPASVEDRTRARARVSAMLSRFQASQRSGRAYSEAHSDDPDADVPADKD